jgi:23S rRNA (cytosine1962-C5)-methyltransferase
MAIVRLKPGHVQPVWAGHPWVYAQAIDRIEGNPASGDEVSVVDPRGNVLGRGFYSAGSAIPVRILVRDPETQLDAAFFRARLDRASARRRDLGLPTGAADLATTTGYRLVHAEGDELPGLIVDRFGDTLVAQLLTIGMKSREGMILDALLSHGTSIVDRTPLQTAKMEGFVAGSGVVRGDATGELSMKERGLAYRLPPEIGQKTGFYFDQRGLRARVEELARGKRVLDTYSYVGAFAMAAARGGAEQIVAVDDSAIAIEVAKECARANGLDGRIEHKKEDARRALQEAGAGDGYDLVVVDPPRLAPSRGAREGALVAYSKLAELGCRATRTGGLLVFCSCSAAVDLGALTRALAIGALHAGKQAFILERHFQGADHPVTAAFPEGLYLKALIARMERR